MDFAIIIYSLGALYIFCSLIHLLPIDHWSVQAFVFPQLQFLGFGVLVLVAGLWQLNISNWYNLFFICSLILVMVYQLWLIFPYTIFNKTEIKATSSPSDFDLKVLVSNVYQPNKRYNDVLELIENEDPDIVLLVETDERWEKEMRPLEESYPYHLKKPLSNMYGLLFYSRKEIDNAEIRYLVKNDIPSVKATIKLNDSKKMMFIGVHPEPPSPTENYRSTERDAELYLLGKEIHEMGEDVPVVVAGDLNDVAWSKSTKIFQKISKLLDPRKGRGFFNTFHAKYPIKWPLDHFFISKHFTLVGLKVHSSIGSDHNPISLCLDYQKINGNKSIDRLEEEEKEEMQRQINKATI